MIFRAPGRRAPTAGLLPSSRHPTRWSGTTFRPGPRSTGRGIATLDPVVCDEGPEQLADRIDEKVAALLEAGVFPVVLGGEHSVSIGAIRAAARLRPGTSVLQIDAHADTRDEYQGSKFNHACVMARARELCPVVQVGIRAVDISEMAGLDPHLVFWAHDIAAAGRDHTAWMDDAVSPLGDPVWVTIDLDGFDPSVLPATGTPEPGGSTGIR